MTGRPFETLYASGSGSPASYSYYNSLGQLTNETDPDSIATFYVYNGKGELAYTVVDVNQNGLIDYSGTDRILLTTNDVTNDTVNVRRTSTYAWNTGSNSSNVVVDGRVFNRWAAFIEFHLEQRHGGGQFDPDGLWR